MSRTLTISDDLYSRLESEAHSRGLKTVEELLARLQSIQTDTARRKDEVRQIDLLRERLFARYGLMPDSVELFARRPRALMTKLVVDANVAIKWFVPEPLSTDARRILGRVSSRQSLVTRTGSDQCGGRHIVWKKQSFQGLDPDDAKTIEEFRKLAIVITPTANLLEKAYDLAVMHKRSVYDSLYMALSIREGCAFVTADEKLVMRWGHRSPRSYGCGTGRDRSHRNPNYSGNSSRAGSGNQKLAVNPIA